MYFQTQNLSVGYHRRPLIEEIDIGIWQGGILCLIGPNGSGKSTILRSITRHLAKLGGVVTISGKDLDRMSDRELARHVSVVLTDRVEPELMTCWEVVAAGRYPYTNHFGKLSPEDVRIVEDSMERVNALELREQRFTELSDGQKQRVLLARALCAARSLLILDEIGRGTSTYDGMAIARAVLEYCADRKRLGAKTLFATHYHELTALEGEIPGVKNYNIAAKKRGNDLIFLRKIVRGSADQSYGIEVAKLAGVPDRVIRRARTILEELESGSGVLPAGGPALPADGEQVSLMDLGSQTVLKKLRMTDVNILSPIEALNLLAELKQDLQES